MEGKELRAGAVVGLEGIRNPVLAARHVMDLPHVMLTDRGARRIALAHKLPLLPEPGPEAYRKLERMKKINTSLLSLYQTYFSTVGAVALDGSGDLAAGSSTGGIPAMLPGRVGDTPVIGAGIFADNMRRRSCVHRDRRIYHSSLSGKRDLHAHEHFNPLQGRVPVLKEIIRLGRRSRGHTDR